MIKPALQVISAEYVNRSKSEIINIWNWNFKGLENKVHVWLKLPVKKSSVPGLDLSFQTKEPIYFRHNAVFRGDKILKEKVSFISFII